MARKSLLYTLFTTLTLALSSSIPQTDYDVIVVGGGPSGLSALSSLARVRRRTAMFDSGEYRNAPTREMHDVIGNDGTPPAQFRALARTQISKYDTATIIDNKISSISPLTDPNNTTYFQATTTNGTTYTSRKIILGTGLIDLIPDVPGLREAWGQGIWWCPWCDGWEHRDEPLGILGSLPDVVGSVLETHTLYSDIIAFTNGTATPANQLSLASKYPNWEKQLAAWDVRVDNRSIVAIDRLQNGNDHRDNVTDQQFDVFRVRFEDGDSVVRNTFITNYPTAQRSTLPEELGTAMLEEKVDTTDYSGMRTSVPGVFAIGDCNSDGSTNVPHAMFSGKRAGVFVHVEMSREESNAAISKRDFSRRALERQTERAVGDEMEMLWKRVLEMRK
ncbi:sulphydryl oxidase [Aspergillus ellipticus CBS 707.79]|uniref:Sulphydryl oxidase n=1 Tax=Aspergillus ellipticus CBS 707.79 TaxID=1448320 RepID=A0A319DPW4_9EURO|nr:sulphydryl oxidase [Aspergillus ellipticus CBS 707.79]